MNIAGKGRLVAEVVRTIEPTKLAELATSLGTASAPATAELVPLFGPTVAGEAALVEALDLDFSRALLAGHSYSWTRPVVVGEEVTIRVSIEDVYEKGANMFGVVATDVVDASGAHIQGQRTTFIERSRS